MKKYKDHTLAEYLEVLSLRTPTPGGGSAAALSAALGVALFSMVMNYSKGKMRTPELEKELNRVYKINEKIRHQFLKYVDLDAEAYLKVVQTRHAAPKIKNAALQKASAVPLAVCQLCYDAIQVAPFLVQEGNKYLVSDVEVGVELLLAAFNSAKINVETNQ